MKDTAVSRYKLRLFYKPRAADPIMAPRGQAPVGAAPKRLLTIDNRPTTNDLLIPIMAPRGQAPINDHRQTINDQRLSFASPAKREQTIDDQRFVIDLAYTSFILYFKTQA